jgi:hypothetical protein
MPGKGLVSLIIAYASSNSSWAMEMTKPGIFIFIGQEFSQRASFLTVGQHDIPLLLGSVFSSIIYYPFLFLSDVLSLTRWLLFYAQSPNRAIFGTKPYPDSFFWAEECLLIGDRSILPKSINATEAV